MGSPRAPPLPPDRAGCKGRGSTRGSPPPRRGDTARCHPAGVMAAAPRQGCRRVRALPTRLGAALFINWRSRGFGSSCRALAGHPARRHAATEPAGTGGREGREGQGCPWGWQSHGARRCHPGVPLDVAGGWCSTRGCLVCPYVPNLPPATSACSHHPSLPLATSAFLLPLQPAPATTPPATQPPPCYPCHLLATPPCPLSPQPAAARA